ncbi:MAG: S41 family peptidase [Eubacterium sp.]
MKEKKGSSFLMILVTVLITLAAASAAIAGYFKATGKEIVDTSEYQSEKDKSEQLDKISEIQDEIDEKYLFDYDETAATDAACRAMLESLGDEYTCYLDADEFKALQDSFNTRFTGAGIVCGQSDNGVIVDEVIEGSPADEAGIQKGDIITAVDGKAVTDVESAKTALRGDAGTPVTITYVRGTADPVDVKIIRGNIENASVSGRMLTGGVGQIIIRSFGDNTARLFDEALTELEGEGMEKLVVDLRNNPGGLFEQSVEIADELLGECLITYTEDKNGSRTEYRSDADKIDIPIAVLVNGQSASASEVLAAALQYNGAAVIVGEKTYGKGLVQDIITFSDGSAMKITSEQYFAPDGTQINGVGVSPDVEVKETAGSTEDVVLQKAIEALG